MNTFAELDRTEQVETLREAGRRLAIEPLMVEKDFWVCWVLAVVFGDRRLGDDIVFKGGTSLSTVYRAIAHFSEDIDLGVTPARLGFDEAELNDAPSATKRRNTSRALLEACTKFVETEMRDHLLADMRKRPGGAELGAASLAYEFDNAIHSPNLLFTYPTALGAEGSYVRKVIKLEFGSLTNQRPKGVHTATSLLERALPGAHADARATVVALELERTFWEKATILHSEAHRPVEGAA